MSLTVFAIDGFEQQFRDSLAFAIEILEHDFVTSTDLTEEGFE